MNSRLLALALFAGTLSAQKLQIQVIVSPISGQRDAIQIDPQFAKPDELKQKMLAKCPNLAMPSLLDREATNAFAPPAPAKGK